jgi:hypothetical protein
LAVEALENYDAVKASDVAGPTASQYSGRRTGIARGGGNIVRSDRPRSNSSVARI